VEREKAWEAKRLAEEEAERLRLFEYIPYRSQMREIRMPNGGFALVSSVDPSGTGDVLDNGKNISDSLDTQKKGKKFKGMSTEKGIQLRAKQAAIEKKAKRQAEHDAEVMKAQAAETAAAARMGPRPTRSPRPRK
jgi:hypothetical protein